MEFFDLLKEDLIPKRYRSLKVLSNSSLVIFGRRRGVGWGGVGWGEVG